MKNKKPYIVLTLLVLTAITGKYFDMAILISLGYLVFAER